MLYIHHPSSLRHDPRALSPDHPDNPLRLRAIEGALARSGLRDVERFEAPAAKDAELALVHSPRHVAFIRDLCAAGGGQVDDDTYRALLPTKPRFTLPAAPAVLSVS